MEMSTIQLQLPRHLLSQAGLSLHSLDEEVRQIIALFLYEQKRISLGKACELAGMTIWEFLEGNTRWEIPIAYNEDDLSADLERLG